MNKIIVLGAPLTGKSTLTAILLETTSTPVLDFDEELIRLNDGKYPANYTELNERLKNQVVRNVSEMEKVIFFAFEISPEDLVQLKESGFKIIQLTASLDVLKSRNEERLKKAPDNDAFKYVETNLKYQNKIKELGIVNMFIDITSCTTVEARDKILLLLG
jgi:shikimate kinase